MRVPLAGRIIAIGSLLRQAQADQAIAGNW